MKAITLTMANELVFICRVWFSFARQRDLKNNADARDVWAVKNCNSQVSFRAAKSPNAIAPLA
jgi:hypothetical protein